MKAGGRTRLLDAIRDRLGAPPPPVGLIFWDGVRYDFAPSKDESFDKVVSVGMYEHVGLGNLPHYFAGALKPGGIFLHHGIVATDPDDRAQGPAGGDFSTVTCFPAGLSRMPRACVRKCRGPAWKPWTWRICARTAPARGACGPGGWIGNNRPRSLRQLRTETESRGFIWLGWRGRSSGDGCPSSRSSPASPRPPAPRRAPGCANTCIPTGPSTCGRNNQPQRVEDGQ